MRTAGSGSTYGLFATSWASTHIRDQQSSSLRSPIGLGSNRPVVRVFKESILPIASTSTWAAQQSGEYPHP